MCGYHMPKQRFIAMTDDSKLHTIVLRCVFGMKLNIGKNITGLEMMAPINQMFPTYRTDV